MEQDESFRVLILVVETELVVLPVRFGVTVNQRSRERVRTENRQART